MKALILFFSVISYSALHAGEGIIFSQSINKKQQQIVKSDLLYLKKINFGQNVSNETLSLLEINQLTGDSLYLWLRARVTYIVEENVISTFKIVFQNTLYVSEKNITYPYPHTLPYSVNEYEVNQELKGGTEAKKDTQVLMSNLGTSLYLSGKEESKIYGLKVNMGLTKKSIKTKINSPRIGIIQLGEGFFGPLLNFASNNLYAKVNSIARLSVLLHEGRHSDGHAGSVGFVHGPCPRGHDYEEIKACDENLNGPYKIGAQLGLEMIKADHSLSSMEKEIAKILILDNKNRILQFDQNGKKTKNWSTIPEVI